MLLLLLLLQICHAFLQHGICLARCHRLPVIDLASVCVPLVALCLQCARPQSSLSSPHVRRCVAKLRRRGTWLESTSSAQSRPRRDPGAGTPKHALCGCCRRPRQSLRVWVIGCMLTLLVFARCCRNLPRSSCGALTSEMCHARRDFVPLCFSCLPFSVLLRGICGEAVEHRGQHCGLVKPRSADGASSTTSRKEGLRSSA